MTPPSSGGRSLIGTLGLVIIAIAALFTVDVFLAKTEQGERLVEAARLFEQGRALMQSGDNVRAVERIKDAIAIDRDNRGYLQTLAEAEFSAGQTDSAEATLKELLQTDSADSLASLFLGRVLVKEGRVEEAISFYHRAIYGHWKDDAAARQLRARLELIDLLAKRNSKAELLAELIAVEDLVPDVDAQARIGRLFLVAGSPNRAADVFHKILHDDPGNAGAHSGLGEAEFARGNYRAAQRDFQAALRLAPDDHVAEQKLEVCNQLLVLDPTTRGLGQAERYRRSVTLVQLTTENASQCAGATPSPELQPLLDSAGEALKAHVIAAHQGEAADSNLDLAEQIWQARKTACPQPAPADNPLTLLLARLAQ